MWALTAQKHGKLRQNIMSCIKRKPDFLKYAKTKAQIRSAVTTQLISTFVFKVHVRVMPLLSKPEIFKKLLTIFCDCTDRFVLDLVRNPKTPFFPESDMIIIEPPHEKTNNLGF